MDVLSMTKTGTARVVEVAPGVEASFL
jgi:hypothetical protein